MTHEMTPQSSNDDPLSRFEALIAREFQEGFELRKKIDKGIARVLDEAEQLQKALNAHTGPVSESHIQEALSLLNISWDNLRIGKEPCSFTGRLRATEHADDEDIFSLVGEDQFRGLSGRDEDSRGYYYAASGFRGVPLGFDVETVHLGDQGVLYQVVMQVGLDEDLADYAIWFTVHPEEIEFIEPYQPSIDGSEAFIAERFPELYAAIQALPDDCKDDERIRRALDDFLVSIDLSKADSEMGDDEVIDMIEQYISDRIGLDNCAYTVEIEGLIQGRRMDYSFVPVHYSGTLRECLMGNIRLFIVDESQNSDGPRQYRPSLELWYLTPERGGGRTPIFAPIDSVKSLMAHRPAEDVYPFGEDTFILANDTTEGDFTVVPLDTPVPVSDDEHTEVIQDPEQSMTHEELLHAYAQELNELQSTLRTRYLDRAYATETEADRALEEADAILERFITRWTSTHDINAPVSIRGEALYYNSASTQIHIDAERKAWNINVDKNELQYGDMFTVMTGRLEGYGVKHVEDDERGYVIRCALTFSDSGEQPMGSVTDREYGIDLFNLTTSKTFLVDLGKEVEFEVDELAYLQRQQEVDMIIQSINDNVRIVAEHELKALQDAMLHEDTRNYTQYSNVDGLRELALTAYETGETIDKVAQAIEIILGRGRVMKIEGPVYDANGNLERADEYSVKLEAVIPGHPFLRVAEPALVTKTFDVETGKIDKTLIIPLSTIEELYY